MCNLIHEEIISHPITGSQEDQVKSGRSFFLSSYRFDETISTWAPTVYKESDVAASTIVRTSTIAEEVEEQEEEEEPTS